MKCPIEPYCCLVCSYKRDILNLIRKNGTLNFIFSFSFLLKDPGPLKRTWWNFPKCKSNFFPYKILTQNHMRKAVQWAKIGKKVQFRDATMFAKINVFLKKKFQIECWVLSWRKGLEEQRKNFKNFAFWPNSPGPLMDP